MSTITSSVKTDGSTRPTVLLLSLDKQFYLDEMYSGLFDSLKKKAEVKEATKPHIALNYLAKHPSAIIVTDPAILVGDPGDLIADPAERDDYLRKVADKVVEYVRNGGITVLATTFSSHVRPDDLSRWFRTAWGLPWESGKYVRTTVHVNPQCRVHQAIATLPVQYSQKAVFLTNVAKDAAVYLPSETSRVESHVFAATRVPVDQAAVAFTKIGNGWLGYVGDVNNEIESQAVVLAMCGL